MYIDAMENQNQNDEGIVYSAVEKKERSFDVVVH